MSEARLLFAVNAVKISGLDVATDRPFSAFSTPYARAREVMGREVKLQKSTVKSAIPPGHAHVLAHPSHPKAATGHPERADPRRHCTLDPNEIWVNFDRIAA